MVHEYSQPTDWKNGSDLWVIVKNDLYFCLRL